MEIFGQQYFPNLNCSDYVLPLFNDGTLTPTEIYQNYGSLDIALVISLRRKNEVIIPIFNDELTARNFTKRNLFNKLHGVTYLSHKFVKYCNNHDYKFVLFDFPKKINPVHGFVIECQTLEFDDKVAINFIKT